MVCDILITRRARVTCGAEFQSLLPGSPRLSKLAQLVRAYVGDELNWDALLMLHPEERRQLALGRGNRLGYDAWLGKSDQAGVGTEELVVEPPTLHDQPR